MKTYVCYNCGYTNQLASDPTFCVYCHAPGESLGPYGDQPDGQGETENWVKKAVFYYEEKPDPVTKRHSDDDSSFRSSLRRALLGMKGSDVSEEQSAKPADASVESLIEEAVQNYSLDAVPIGAVYSELNSALSRQYRRAILGMRS